jgi:hypothetical protein
MFWLTRSAAGVAVLVLGFGFDFLGTGFELFGHLAELPRKRRRVGCGDLAEAPGAFPKKLDLLA